MKHHLSILFAGLSGLMFVLTLALWAGTYVDRWSFAGGGIKAGVGNFKLIVFRGEYLYEDWESYVHFRFWQPATVFFLLSLVFSWRIIPRKSPSSRR